MSLLLDSETCTSWCIVILKNICIYLWHYFNYSDPADFCRTVLEFEAWLTDCYDVKNRRVMGCEFLTKEYHVPKFCYCVIGIKEPCGRIFEWPIRSKILGILQNDMYL